MNIEDLRTFCLSFPATEERLPFNPDYLVFFVHDKMFCLIDITDPHDINLKCAPERAIELRERYAEVTPGYHMNKKHWNTVFLDGLPLTLIKEMIQHSYDQVLAKVPKKEREVLIS